MHATGRGVHERVMGNKMERLTSSLLGLADAVSDLMFVISVLLFWRNLVDSPCRAEGLERSMLIIAILGGIFLSLSKVGGMVARFCVAMKHNRALIDRDFLPWYGLLHALFSC